ncbi:MAG TPA: hypothetical protein VIT45_03990 [Allosphingosinicella sp.]
MTMAAGRGRAAAGDALAGDVRRAVSSGLDFLGKAQLRTGEIPILASTDPTLESGAEPDPSVFPTALAAQALASVAGAGAIRDRALDFLVSEMDGDGLWRHWTASHPHHAQLPPDLDDSSCASSALAMAGRPVPPNRALLLANRRRDGLFFTWVAPRPVWAGLAHAKVSLRRLLRLPSLILFFRRTSAAPFDVDAVVNANCLFCLGDFASSAAVVDHLLSVLRRGDETVCDKWYDNAFVILYFLSRALAGRAPEAGPLVLARLSGDRPANALELALSASSLLRFGHLPSNKAVRSLVALQRECGAWPRAALYHGGRTRIRGGGFAPKHPDTPHWGSEALTTALALEALSLWLDAVEA